MRKIHQLFQQSSSDLIKKATLSKNRTKLCWYPSASDDLRHIYFLEKEGLENPNNPPLVYVCTDMNIPNFLDNRAFSPDRKIISGIRIKDISEVHLKKPIIDISGGVWVWSDNPDNNLSRAFLVLMDIDSFVNDRHVVVSIPLIYLIVENLIFLTDVILSHQMNIHTLIHIVDGGGTMGGSHIPMNFIYRAGKLIKLNRVIADMTVSDKFADEDIYGGGVLEGQCKYIQDKNIFIKKIMERKESNFLSREAIKSRWSSKEIEFPEIQKNPHYDHWFKQLLMGYDVDEPRYYDWQ